MKTLLIVFHSQSGICEQLALSCYQAANEALAETDNVQVRMRRCTDADVDDVLAASLVLFIAAENFAAIAGGMKEFMNRIFYPAERAGLQALPYALLVAAGNDGSNCVRQLDKILLGLNAKAVQAAHIVYSNDETIADSDKEYCQTLAQTLLLGLDVGLY